MAQNLKTDVEPQALIAVRIKEACRLTGIGRSKLYELIAAGEIETRKIGRITVIPMEALRAFLRLTASGR